MKAKVNKPSATKMTASDFIALSDLQKQKIYDEIDNTPPDELYAMSRPLNAKERAEWRKIQKAMKRSVGRPRVGKGVQKVSISVEKSFLHRIDQFVQAAGMKRSEFFVKGAEKILGAAATDG